MNSVWKILVVDDEISMRESLAAWLREDGYVVDVAASGREAVRLLKERSANPSLPPRSVILPTEYIRRASCGPPRAG